MLMLPLLCAISLISILPDHSGSHFDFSSKSHTSSFGIRKPFFAAKMTIAKPTSPPTIDGNSGPSVFATITYGIVIAKAENKANFQIFKPSVKDLFLPKNFVMNATTISGTKVPAIMCKIETFSAILTVNARKSFVILGSAAKPD